MFSPNKIQDCSRPIFFQALIRIYLFFQSVCPRTIADLLYYNWITYFFGRAKQIGCVDRRRRFISREVTNIFRVSSVLPGQATIILVHPVQFFQPSSRIALVYQSFCSRTRAHQL